VTVYVDNIHLPARVGRVNSTWCHLAADSSEELHAFAVSIGMRPEWVQYPGTWREHFDVPAPRRRAAVAAGAVEVSARDLTRWMLRRR
jgi:hypothetical protein